MGLPVELYQPKPWAAPILVTGIGLCFLPSHLCTAKIARNTRTILENCV
jgi:hypothetical protein